MEDTFRSRFDSPLPCIHRPTHSIMQAGEHAQCRARVNRASSTVCAWCVVTDYGKELYNLWW